MDDRPEVHKRITKPRLLVGEGREEVRFFDAFLKHRCITNITVMDYGGKEKLHTFLKSLPGLSGFDQVVSLAVTRDADDDFDPAFQSVRDGLERAGFSTPARCEETADGPPKTSVFILPDCGSPGMLESLCLRSIQDQPAIECVDAYFECMRSHDRIADNKWKARVHAWLASENKPDMRLGEAAEAGYWPFDHDAFAQLEGFLQAL